MYTTCLTSFTMIEEYTKEEVLVLQKQILMGWFQRVTSRIHSHITCVCTNTSFRKDTHSVFSRRLFKCWKFTSIPCAPFGVILVLFFLSHIEKKDATLLIHPHEHEDEERSVRFEATKEGSFPTHRSLMLFPGKNEGRLCERGLVVSCKLFK